MKRMSKEEFVTKAIAVHGNKYNYDKVEYVNYMTKVQITCNACGNVFLQRPSNHLRGQGCERCGVISRTQIKIGKPRISMRKPLLGQAILDYDDIVAKGKDYIPSYSTWRQMLSRCYSDLYIKHNPTYIDVTVCDEWLTFSNFKKWFDEHYIDGYVLDKDILVKGNKVYSPQTCCFVPAEINAIFKHYVKKNGLPQGITTRRGKYIARHKGKHLITTSNFKEAYDVLKETKEAYIKEIATKYFKLGKITKEVYEAMMNY